MNAFTARIDAHSIMFSLLGQGSPTAFNAMWHESLQKPVTTPFFSRMGDPASVNESAMMGMDLLRKFPLRKRPWNTSGYGPKYREQMERERAESIRNQMGGYLMHKKPRTQDEGSLGTDRAGRATVQRYIDAIERNTEAVEKNTRGGSYVKGTRY